MRLLALVSVSLLLSPACAASSVAAERSDPAAWGEVEVPGYADLLELLGIPPSLERARVTLEIIRLLHRAPPQDDLRSAATTTRAVGRLRTAARDSDPVITVPLPLDAAFWRDEILRGAAAEPLYAAILGDHRAALLYYGLAALDEGTLRWIRSEPDVARAIYERHASTFAAFGRCLRVEDGRAVTPGGTESVPLWESLAGAPIDDPEDFWLGVLGRDAGRLAYLVDSIAHLDAAHQRFALGTWIDPVPLRRETFGRLYDVVASLDTNWNPALRPFSRASWDLRMILPAVAVHADGRPQRPASRGFWASAFAGRPFLAGPDATDQDPDPFDAAWIVGAIGHSDRQARRTRYELLQFGQRLAGRPGNDAVALPALAAAVGARRQLPTLALALERMEIDDPELYARAAVRAQGLGQIPGAGPGDLVVRLLQGALALLERMSLTRGLDADAMRAQLDALLAIGGAEPSAFGGDLARWLATSLLPALDSQAPTREAQLIEGLTGAARWRPPPPIEWEGQPYVVDPSASEVLRITRHRVIQGGPTLDDVLDLRDGLDRLGEATDASDRGAAADRIEAAVTAMARRGELVTRPGTDTLPARGLGAVQTVRRANGAAAELRQAASALSEIHDRRLATVLTSLNYAIHLGDPDGAVRLGGNIAVRHTWGGAPIESGGRVPMPGAWSLPEERLGDGPWHVRGSLLGLDMALARLAARRLIPDYPATPPAITEFDRRAVLQTLVLLNPFALDEASRDAIAGAIRRGTERIVAAQGDPAALDRLASEATMSEWRRRALAWMVTHEPDRSDGMFSLVERYWLGRAGGTEPVPHAWGANAYPAAGCLCLRLPAPAYWEDYQGRPGSGLLAAGFGDILLRTAQFLSSRRLPAALARGVAARAAGDFLDEARAANYDDWFTLVQYAQTLTDAQFEDYVAALAFEGPLVPAPEGHREHP